MTFEDAVDIMYGITVPKSQQEIMVQTIEGTKVTVRAEVRGQLALYCHNRNWHLIHVLTGLTLMKSKSYEEMEDLMNEIGKRKLDLVFTMRDWRLCVSILNLLFVREEFINSKKQSANVQVK